MALPTTFLERLVQSLLCKTPRTQENELYVQHGLVSIRNFWESKRRKYLLGNLNFVLGSRCVVMLRGLGEFWIWAKLALGSL